MLRYLRKARASDLHGTALVRLDFNTEDGWRIEAALPTLRLLLARADKIVVVSHKGRPKKREPRLSLKKSARALQRLLGRKIIFIPHFRFALIKKIIARAPRRSIFLLENIRFLKGETTKRPELAKTLAGLADYFVNDAFPVLHHPGASVTGVARFLPSYAGMRLEEEVWALSRVMRKPKRPLVLVVGGAKAHDKLGVLRYFEKKADAILLGGAPANTLLQLRGVEVGKSLVDEKRDWRALRKFAWHKKVFLPLDWRSERGAILDIGPRTVSLFREKARRAKTLIWSGPLGLIEKKRFAHGTLEVAKEVAANRRAFSVTGGGETVTFLKKHKLNKKFSFVSTGGGAMLDFLAGEKLPGVATLERRIKRKS